MLCSSALSSELFCAVTTLDKKDIALQQARLTICVLGENIVTPYINAVGAVRGVILQVRL